MRTGRGFEHADKPTPQCAAEDAGEQHERQQENAGQVRQIRVGADHRRGNRAHNELTLDADVEQPCAKRDGDGKAGEDQRRGECDCGSRLKEPWRRAIGAEEPRAADNVLIGLRYVVASGHDDDGAEDKRQEQRPEGQSKGTSRLPRPHAELRHQRGFAALGRFGRCGHRTSFRR